MKNQGKSRYFRLILCLMLVFTLAAACAPAKTTPTPVPTTTPVPTVEPTPTPTPTPTPVALSPSDYLPFKLGSTWEYKGSGNEYASYTQKVLYQKGNRSQLRYDNGGTVMAIVMETRKDSIVNTYREGESYDDKNVLGKPANNEEVLLKAPLEKGTAWVSNENSYEIVDTNAKAVVPAGTFNGCIQVKITYKDKAEMNLYYAQNVGLVLSEFIGPEGDVISSSLVKYELGK